MSGSSSEGGNETEAKHIHVLVSLAALYLVGGACATHRRDILSAGGGGNWERLRRVPRPHGDHRQTQRHQQRGAGTALPLTATHSQWFLKLMFFGFNIIPTHSVCLFICFFSVKWGVFEEKLWFLYSCNTERPAMLGCLGWFWMWLNAPLLC